MAPGDKLICTFVEPQAVGAQFGSWPLHVTIVPWFRTDLTVRELTDGLKSQLWNTRPFSMHLQGTARFGARKQLVHLVQVPSPIEPIEQRVRSYLQAHSRWIVDEVSGRRQFQFRPHVTDQALVQAHDGSSFVCGAIYVVEQMGMCKTVIAKVSLI